MQDMHCPSSRAHSHELQRLRLLAERFASVMQDTMLWQVRLAGWRSALLTLACPSYWQAYVPLRWLHEGWPAKAISFSMSRPLVQPRNFQTWLCLALLCNVAASPKLLSAPLTAGTPDECLPVVAGCTMRCPRPAALPGCSCYSPAMSGTARPWLYTWRARAITTSGGGCPWELPCCSR